MRPWTRRGLNTAVTEGHSLAEHPPGHLPAPQSLGEREGRPTASPSL